MRPFIELRPSNDPASKTTKTEMCAAALFLRDGIANVRMTDIAEASGVGVATLYRRYQTKTRLAIAAGTRMWERFNELIRAVVEDDSFLALTGAERLMRLFENYVDSYLEHPDFMRFLDEFDHLVVTEAVPQAELAAYGQSIDMFYLIFEDAYQMGRADGSVANGVDFPVFYRTVAHAVMGIAQKVGRGEIIPSDDFTQGRLELECLMHMARHTLGITDAADSRGIADATGITE